MLWMELSDGIQSGESLESKGFFLSIFIRLYFHVISVFSIYPDVFKIHITGFYIKQKVDVMNKSLIDIFKLFNSMIGVLYTGQFDVVFTNLHGGHPIMLCSSPLLRQVGYQYDKITDNIFMLHYLLSPCNLYM